MQTCLKQRWATNEMTVKASEYSYTRCLEQWKQVPLQNCADVVTLRSCNQSDVDHQVSCTAQMPDNAPRKCSSGQQIVLSVHPDKVAVEDHQNRPNLSEFPKSNLKTLGENENVDN
jgi:hypothetical protein